MIRTSFRKALTALGALSLAACSTLQSASAPEAPRPAMWKLSDADTTIYLFGTIHLLPEGLQWRTPALDQAIAASDSLVLETTIGSNPTAAAQTMMKLALTPGLPPLIERVPEDKRAALQKMIDTTGVPPKLLDGMETWAAALTLLAVSFREMGFNPDLGVEKGLEASYKASAKPVTGLETVEQQFGFFDTLSEEAQRTFLAGMADAPEDARAQFQAMLEAWSSGDTDAIAATFDSETALLPELRETLMKRRNAAWADWLARRLDEPGTVMVAVGAGHLVGRDSVQAMLKARGLRTKRVQ